MIRATPTIQRRALEIAAEFTKTGILFIPIPVRSIAEYDALVEDTLIRLQEGFDTEEGGD